MTAWSISFQNGRRSCSHCSTSGCRKDGQQKENFSKLVKALTKMGDAVAAGTKETASVARQKVQALRNVQTSSMHLTTFAMLDLRFRTDVHLVTFATARWRQFHGYIQKNVINGETAGSFIADTVHRRGAFWDALEEAGQPFQRIGELKKIGFVVCADDMPHGLDEGINSVGMQINASLHAPCGD